MAENKTKNTEFSREEFETNIARGLRWFMIVFFFIVTVFPFYWMVNLSFRPEQDIQTNPTKLAPSWSDIQTTMHPVRLLDFKWTAMSNIHQMNWHHFCWAIAQRQTS